MGKSRAGNKKKPAAGGSGTKKAHADPVAPLNRAHELSQEGQRLYKAGQLLEAIDKYGQALALTPEGHQDRAVLHSDRAACMLLVQPVRYDEVIRECTASLDLNSKYLSALLQRAKAHEQLANYDAALQDVEEVLKNEAHNEEAEEACKRLHSHIESGKAAKAALPAREATASTASPPAAKAKQDASGPSPKAGSGDSPDPAANLKATRGASRKDVSQPSAPATPQPVPPSANHAQGLVSRKKPKAGSVRDVRETSKIAGASLAKPTSAAAAAIPAAAVSGGTRAPAATGKATGGTSLEGSRPPSTSTSPKNSPLIPLSTAKDVQGPLLETKSKNKAGRTKAKRAAAAAAVPASTVSSSKGAPAAKDSATGGTSLKGSPPPSPSTSPTSTAIPSPPTADGVQEQSLETKSKPKAGPLRAKQDAAAAVVSATTATSATGASTANDSATGGTSVEEPLVPSPSTSPNPVPLSPSPTKTKRHTKAERARAKQAAAAAAAEVSTSTVSGGDGAPAASGSVTGGASLEGSILPAASTSPTHAALPQPPAAEGVQGHGSETKSKPTVEPPRAEQDASAAVISAATVPSATSASAANDSATGVMSLEWPFLPTTSTSPNPVPLPRPPTKTKSKLKGELARAKQAATAAAAAAADVSTSTVSSGNGAPAAPGGTSLEGSIIPSTSTSAPRTALPQPPTPGGVQGHGLESETKHEVEPLRAKQGAASAAAGPTSTVSSGSGAGAPGAAGSATGGTSVEGYLPRSMSTSPQPTPLPEPPTADGSQGHRLATKTMPETEAVRAKQAAAAASAAPASTVSSGSEAGAPGAMGSVTGGKSMEEHLVPSTSTSPQPMPLPPPLTPDGAQGHQVETKRKPEAEAVRAKQAAAATTSVPTSTVSSGINAGAPGAADIATGGTSMEEYVPPSTSTSPQPTPLPPSAAATDAHGHGLETKKKPKAEAVRPWELATADNVRFPLADGERNKAAASGGGEGSRRVPAGPKESAQGRPAMHSSMFGAPGTFVDGLPSYQSGNAPDLEIYKMGTAAVDTVSGKGALAVPVGIASLALGPGAIGLGAYLPMQILHLGVSCRYVAALNGSEWEVRSLLDLGLKKLARNEANARARPDDLYLQDDGVSVMEMEEALRKSCDEEVRANMDQSVRELACSRSHVTAVLDQNLKEMKRLLTDLLPSIGLQDTEAALLSRTEIESLQALTLEILELHGSLFQNLIVGNHCQREEAEKFEVLAMQLLSKLTAILQEIPQGHPRRFPLVLLQVFASRAIVDAHSMFDCYACSLSRMRTDDYNFTVLRDAMALLACEARSLVSHSTCTPYSIAVDSAPALAHYLLLYKSLVLALEGQIWTKPALLGQDGALFSADGKESVLWDDGMDEIRAAAADGMDELQATTALPHTRSPGFWRGVESKVQAELTDFHLEVKLGPVDSSYFGGVSFFSRCWQGLFACFR